MDFSYLLYKAKPDTKKLLAYGFSMGVNQLEIKLDLEDPDFYTAITLTDTTFIAEAYENNTNELYALLNVKKAQGTFVNELRNQIKTFVEDIFTSCFDGKELNEPYEKWLQEKFEVTPEFPWGTPDYIVYRLKNQKWLCLMMKIPFNKIGIDSDEKVWVVNIKADQKEIPELIDNKSIFPAWHMNKKNWITVLLTSRTDFETIKKLTEKSFELVSSK